jgi:benzoyl-CoA reductase/2-hydroxyglutaryl-CoA dehydratase subunit BcrC/BadD/HgdB
MLALPTRAEAIARARDQGRRVAAVLPIHYPRALLRAHGFEPIEVWGPPGVDTTLGNRHFQSYACPIVRNAASFLLGPGGDALDVVVVPHTCDALQGLASVLRDFLATKQPVLTLYLPRGRRGSDAAFLVDELRRLGGELARISGVTPSDADLAAAVDAEDAAAAASAALLVVRDRLALSDRELFALLRSRECLPPARFVELAAAAPRGEAPVAAGSVRLMLSGIVPEPMEIFDVLAAAGARVVADDLACGSRRAYPRVDERDPWRRMARALLAAPPEPTLGLGIEDRVDLVRSHAVAARAAGVVVVDPTFCEPELFYLPKLREGLERANIPLLHLEVELGGALPAQLETRLEAFVETLR